MGRSVTGRTDDRIHKTEVQWADQSQVVLMTGSIRQLQRADHTDEGIQKTEVQWADCSGSDP